MARLLTSQHLFEEKEHELVTVLYAVPERFDEPSFLGRVGSGWSPQGGVALTCHRRVGGCFKGRL